MITVDHVTKTYGTFTAVVDVTFTALPGRITGFLGPNGAGKSTTLRVLVGLTSPERGTAHVLERTFRDLPNPGIEVGVLLDASAQHAGRTGREVLTIAQRTMGLPRARVEEVLDQVGLSADEAGRRVRDYSLGNGSGWLTPCSAIPRSSFSTSRPTGSTRPASGGCETCCAAMSTVARPCCCPRTYCTRSRSSPTTWS